MGEPLRARTTKPLTPAQALYDVLASTGFVHQKVEFARIVDVNARNIYSYLGDPESEKPRGFIPASIEKLHGWAHAIARYTAAQGAPVRVEIRLSPEGPLVLIAEGTSSNGSAFGPLLYHTTYDKYPSWGFKERATDG
jgi:hypothetical protein